MLYTQLRRTVESWWHLSLVSGIVCVRERRTTKCLWQRSLPQRVVRNVYDKEACVNMLYAVVNLKSQYNNKILRSRCCILLKLTIARQEASRGLSATAELLVIRLVEIQFYRSSAQRCWRSIFIIQSIGLYNRRRLFKMTAGGEIWVAERVAAGHEGRVAEEGHEVVRYGEGCSPPHRGWDFWNFWLKLMHSGEILTLFWAQLRCTIL